MIRTSGRRRLTCHHEAGHLLARWYFGHFFDCAYVFTVQQVGANQYPIDRKGRVIDDCEGVCIGYDVAPPPFLTPATILPTNTTDGVAKRIISFAQISAFSGMVESLAGPIAEARYRKCSVAFAILTGGNKDLESYKAARDTWFYENSEEAGNGAWRDAAALVRSAAGWEAIKAMAKVLFDRGELGGDTAASICKAAYGVQDHPGLCRVMERWPPDTKKIRRGGLWE